MYNKEIIVTLTSWKKRIEFVPHVIYMMLEQTLKPTKIILNLSSDEFINKEKDLPKDLILLQENIDIFEIYWVKENTKAFKKLLPTLERYIDKDCWILTIDDDCRYDKTYIEFMVNAASSNPNYCITPGGAGLWPHGATMIYDTKFFKNKTVFNITIEEQNKIIASDKWYEASIYSNGYKFLKVKEIINHVKFLNCGNPLGKSYSSPEQIKFRKKFITEKFKEMGYDISIG